MGDWSASSRDVQCVDFLTVGNAPDGGCSGAANGGWDDCSAGQS